MGDMIKWFCCIAVGGALGMMILLWDGARLRADLLEDIVLNDHIGVDADNDGTDLWLETPGQIALRDKEGRVRIVFEWENGEWVYIEPPRVKQPWSSEIDGFHKSFLDFYGADSLVFSILKIDGKKLSANERYVGY